MSVRLPAAIELHQSTKNCFLLHGKIKCDLHRSDVAESKYGNPNALDPATFKGEEFKLKTPILNKNNI
jgi:hypothetical protein